MLADLLFLLCPNLLLLVLPLDVSPFLIRPAVLFDRELRCQKFCMSRKELSGALLYILRDSRRIVSDRFDGKGPVLFGRTHSSDEDSPIPAS